MFLIMSSAYVCEELRAEFGLLPPSFLPLGNRRLYTHQVELAECEDIYLSLPETYDLAPADQKWLREKRVQTVSLPGGLGIGEALVACLNLIDYSVEEPLKLLFGDTLVSPAQGSDDFVAVSEVRDGYDWSVLGDEKISWLSDFETISDQDRRRAICGYFCFRSPRALIRSIALEAWDFLGGLSRYRNEFGLAERYVENWYDFGHVNTYYRSKAAFTTQRAFNTLNIRSGYVEKSSKNEAKIRAESEWFKCLPPMMRLYTPTFLGDSTTLDNRFCYKLEYLHNTALSELWVFSRLSAVTWKRVFKHCIAFLKECQMQASSTPPVELSELLVRKTDERLPGFLSSKNVGTYDVWHIEGIGEYSIQDAYEESCKYLPKKEAIYGFFHGDFCFSNILYDFRTDRIRVIDPRATTLSGNIATFGDLRYDLAKLSHSVLGMYDWIVAGFHDSSVDWIERKVSTNFDVEERVSDIQEVFIEVIYETFGLTPLNLYAMQVQLFMSMLPLHSDDKKRQKGLFANVFRIFALMQKEIK